MTDGPLELLRAREARRVDAAKGVSERTRTFCLGALALIWGIFSEKKGEGSLNASLFWKRILLGTGIALVVVLVADFLEFVAGFQELRVQAGEITADKGDYAKWQRRLRVVKLSIAALALAALLIALLSILATPLFASATEYPYTGSWCGGETTYGLYTQLRIGQSAADGLAVQLALQNDTTFVDCSEISERDDNHLVAKCGHASIDVGTYNNEDSRIQVDVSFDNQPPSGRILAQCP
jgi:hypothetical protein